MLFLIKNKPAKRITMTVILLGVLGGVLGYYFKQSSGTVDEKQPLKVTADYQGVDWSLRNQKGETVQLSQYQGRPVMLVFWATWCPYCKKLLPGIETLNQKYESKGLKIIAVNIKEDWKPKLYWKNHEYSFDTVLNGDEVAKDYGVSGTPSVVFIEPSGKVLGVKSFSDPNHPLLEKFAQQFLKSSTR